MPTASEHYSQLLAEHYLWMMSLPFEQKVAEQKALLESVLSHPPPSPPAGPALDLGCGPGFQSLALAELGYSPVIAIDSSRKLLLELEARTADHPIDIIESDLTALASLPLREKSVVIVCMGDTITHLPSRKAVAALCQSVFEKLSPGGVFLITYRDLSREMTGLDRFIPVQADGNKILTCFLEYQDDEFVTVHDLLHLREGSTWQLKKSSYRKCRLSIHWMTQTLQTAGFQIEQSAPAGRLHLIAARRET